VKKPCWKSTVCCVICDR